MRAGAKGFHLKLFHKQVCYERAEGGTHSSTLDLFLILTLKEEEVLVRQNSGRVVICCIDMLVLCGIVGSCTFIGKYQMLVSKTP